MSVCSANLQPLRKWRCMVNKRCYRKGSGDTRERHRPGFSEQKAWWTVVLGFLTVLKETGSATSGIQFCFDHASSPPHPHPLGLASLVQAVICGQMSSRRWGLPWTLSCSASALWNVSYSFSLQLQAHQVSKPNKHFFPPPQFYWDIIDIQHCISFRWLDLHHEVNITSFVTFIISYR